MTMMTKWQPIETAPRDGTVVLLFQPHSQVGYMFVGVLNNRGEWVDNIMGEDHRPTPTHWQPLPEPPTMKEVFLGEAIGGKLSTEI